MTFERQTWHKPNARTLAKVVELAGWCILHLETLGALSEALLTEP